MFWLDIACGVYSVMGIPEVIRIVMEEENKVYVNFISFTYSTCLVVRNYLVHFSRRIDDLAPLSDDSLGTDFD